MPAIRVATWSLAVELPQPLIQSLRQLSDAMDDSVADVEAVLSVLTDDLAAAIPYYLGLTITLQVEDSTVIVTTLEPGLAVIAASLHLPLLPGDGFAGDPYSANSVVFYSGAARFIRGAGRGRPADLQS